MHENSDFLRLVVNSIRKDLESHSEINNCLALHAIANVGGEEMAESLAPDVHRLLISPCVKCFLSNVMVLMRKQDFAELCEEEGCLDALTSLQEASNRDSSSRMGATHRLHHG